MTLPELADIILTSGGSGFKNRTFNVARFEPIKAFKVLERLDLSYSTISQFKECKIKFAAKKFLDMGFFKTGEALFLGNVVHKFIEDLIAAYTSGTMSFDNYNDVARSVFESIRSKFDKTKYPTEEIFVENMFKYVMGRKKFQPDLFFEDLSFLSGLASKNTNYVESKKEYFQNAARLMKQLFGIAKQINATQFNVEQWIKFKIDGLPVQFTGKIDLYFPFIKDGVKYVCIVDFKTGKKEYFHWDQLNYYALYFGEKQFENMEKYFFDIKECDRYPYKKSIGYQAVYDHLKERCSEISTMHDAYAEVRDVLREKYAEKLDGILRKANADDIHKVPCDIAMMMFDILNKDFFKAKKIADYHSNGGFACNYCDVLNFCSIRT